MYPRLYPNREAALEVEDQVDFIPGIGYMHVGTPDLRRPAIHTPIACTPSDTVEDMDKVELLAPSGAKIKFFWIKEKALFRVIQAGKGNRVAFSPAYLASHGWRLP